MPYQGEAIRDGATMPPPRGADTDKELDTSILPTPEAYRAQMREMEIERQQAMEVSEAV
ncbi:hypothetical protein Pmar_PMAR013999, partial [Perkinsus marinus ATCC 50983]